MYIGICNFIMNILASYNWIKEHVRTNLTPEEFAQKISLSGSAVERIYPQGENLENIVIGEIVDIDTHPNADKLSIVKVRIGTEIKEIVCGGINLKLKMKVAVAQIGAKVRWHGEGDLVELQPAKIRGVESHGMICAANEIGLFDYFPHQDREIMDISEIEAPPGTPLREALELNDVVFDIEVTTNRPDAFSMVGLAREASVLMDLPFLWKPSPTNYQLQATSSLDITIDAPTLCTRYQGVVLKGVQVKPSPWWMQKRLLASGIRPINNVVDITNYVMLEQGQPMHVFDADLLMGAENKKSIVVRTAKKSEKMEALDGNIYELDESMLVITDGKKPVAIAGVMGGEESGVTRDTTTIIFESATFDPVGVRKTARKLNLHSDSSLRFEKGLSTEATTAAISRAVELAIKIAGAELATPILDKRVRPYKAKSFDWDPEVSKNQIGVEISTAGMKKILEDLGFEISGSGKKLNVTVPYWRDHDIEASVDFTEEIARTYGYHKLPSVIPSGELPLSLLSKELILEDKYREILQGAGFIEVYSYSFVSEEFLKKGLWGGVPVLKVQNPLTLDLAIMRPSIIPSLLQVVKENEIEVSSGSIFEVANIYPPRENELPFEHLVVAGAVWGESGKGELFFKLKGILELIQSRFGAKAEIINKESDVKDLLLGHPGRRAIIFVDKKEVGVIEEVHPVVLQSFGIKNRVAVFQFDANDFVATAFGISYKGLPEFPPVRRDISFIVDEKVTYENVVDIIKNVDEHVQEAELFDVYQGKGVDVGKKSMALHLVFVDPTKTLTGEEADVIFNKIVKALEAKVDAQVRLV